MKNNVILIRRNPNSKPAEYFASIGHGQYQHGRITAETLYQEEGESDSQLYSRASRRCDEINEKAP